MTKITIPPYSLVVLMGAMGTGKSTFCAKHFEEHHVVSTDSIRQQLSGNFEDQSVNAPTFDILYATVEARAKAGILTIIDSTGSAGVLQRVSGIARTYKRPLILIKFPELKPEQITEERMQHRMRYIHAYHNQVERIRDTSIPKNYTVYELDDIDSVEIVRNDPIMLDSRFSYTVVPDLHGEQWVIDHYADMLEHEPNHRFIFLGDIVDRGQSSYETFLTVNRLIEEGKAVGVRSNHDDKLTRYFRKWLNDEDTMKYYYNSQDNLPAYGMRLAYGLQKTIEEFYSLSNSEMDDYANGFVDYYNKLPFYLRLVKDDTTHFFAHAGINGVIAKGLPLGKREETVCLYRAVTEADQLDEFFDGKDKVIVHVGHVYEDDTPVVKVSKNKPNLMLIQHDVGLGKREVENVPSFITL